MIKRLKRRFIALAMVSLIALLTVIVSGMNLINYNTVISEADQKLEALSGNGGRLPFFEDESFGSRTGQDLYSWMYGSDDYDDIDAETRDGFLGFGHGRPFSSRDEAEETRFFSVLITGEKTVLRANTDRIYAVDDSAAGEYAIEALKKGTDSGFIDNYRYSVTSEGSLTRITFLDCSSSLSAFRKFLYASIIMSVAGLIIIFAFICYFAGRIVRPVAESYEKQKRFITDAGHEIKTPLAIIKANLDVMRMDLEDIEGAAAGDVMRMDLEDIEDAAAGDSADETSAASPECADYKKDTNSESKYASSMSAAIRESTASLNESLDDIGGQVDRLTSLTNDLVYLSRMEEGGNSLTMTEIPASDIVTETAESFSALAVERKKHLDINVTPMLSMQGSSKEIEKLVSILTENALKYSPEGDTIHVCFRKEGKNAVLEVRNKAVDPVSDEDLAHVFERFYRSDKSRNSASGGHGIGLSMASAITSAHGGKIRANNGDGSEFIVTASLPLI